MTNEEAWIIASVEETFAAIVGLGRALARRRERLRGDGYPERDGDAHRLDGDAPGGVPVAAEAEA